nr:immunoglobulin heavy chain junction region [Mus musculus]
CALYDYGDGGFPYW